MVGDCYFNVGTALDPTKTRTVEQKMGLPPAHVRTTGVVVDPEPRRWLSQFFVGILDKTEKRGKTMLVDMLKEWQNAYYELRKP